MLIKISSLSELKKFAKAIQKSVGRSGMIIALIGELGAGKTTFAKFFLRAAGIKNKVTSPTFILANRYQKSGQNYFHLDLYRLKNFKAVAALGIPESWQRGKDIFLIEWADKIKRQLPKKTVLLKFKVRGNQRQIQILNAPPKMARMTGKLYN